MYPLNPPITGDWPLTEFPETIVIDGKTFRKAKRKQPYLGVVEQYREDIPRDTMHLCVFDGGEWIIDHVDEYNPDLGFPARHFFIDHPIGKVFLFTGAGLISMGIAVTRGIKQKGRDDGKL